MVKREPGAKETAVSCLKQEAEAEGLAWIIIDRVLPREMVQKSGFEPSSGSSSECMPIKFWPELYLFSRTELNLSPSEENNRCWRCCRGGGRLEPAEITVCLEYA